jgi:hypothetical protein
MDGAGAVTSHTEAMEPLVFEYPRCALRDASQAVARALPPLRVAAGLAWPAARRADRVCGSQIEVAETLPGFAELAALLRRPWLELAAWQPSHTAPATSV